MTFKTTLKTAISSTVVYAAVAASLIGAHTMTSASAAPTLHQAVAQPAAAVQLIAPAQTKTAILSGTFVGASKHITKGTARVVQTATGYQLILDKDFYLDGAPSPVIGFGTDGTYDASTQFTKLTKKRGAQTYDIPSGFILSNVNQVFIWCEDFSVPLGIADLNAA